MIDAAAILPDLTIISHDSPCGDVGLGSVDSDLEKGERALLSRMAGIIESVENARAGDKASDLKEQMDVRLGFKGLCALLSNCSQAAC